MRRKAWNLKTSINRMKRFAYRFLYDWRDPLQTVYSRERTIRERRREDTKERKHELWKSFSLEREEEKKRGKERWKEERKEEEGREIWGIYKGRRREGDFESLPSRDSCANLSNLPCIYRPLQKCPPPRNIMAIITFNCFNPYLGMQNYWFWRFSCSTPWDSKNPWH